MAGMNQWWPLAGLRLGTPRLELRLPTDNDLDELAGLAAAGVHDPEMQPFEVPWTDAPPADRARSTLQYHWSQRAAWQPAKWSLIFVTLGSASFAVFSSLTVFSTSTASLTEPSNSFISESIVTAATAIPIGTFT